MKPTYSTATPAQATELELLAIIALRRHIARRTNRDNREQVRPWLDILRRARAAQSIINNSKEQMT